MNRLIFLSALACLSGMAQEPHSFPGPVDFARDVQPVLSRCTMCHGAALQQAGLRVDSREALLAGGKSGPALVPGQGAASLLLKRVAGADGMRVMPPSGPALQPEQIALLRAWIDQGAAWGAAKTGRAPAALWSLQPLKRPAAPVGEANPIDAFVRARLGKEGIAPSPEAPRATLLRRLSLDLTGLPPTPGELAAFLADREPGAYERQVDRLLASPHYGEKWGRHWLDLARYADSDGYEKDWERPWAWRYREWVIEAINQDLPFDRFTLYQIAGDLLPNPTVDQQVATGFQRMTLTNREGGVDNTQFRFENTVDRTSTVATVWLGLTMGCAQCHDHKYDPISQKDFYRLFAFFDNVEEVQVDAPMPGEFGPYLRTHSEYEAKREQLLNEYRVHELQAPWEKEMLRAEANPGERTDWDLAWDCLLKLTEGGDGEKIIHIPAEARTKRQRDVLTTHFVRNYHFAVGPKEYKKLGFDVLDKKLRALEESYPQLTQAMAVVESSRPEASHVRLRGDYKSLGDEVRPAAPAVLPAIAAANPTRLDLARWLTSEANPLTARVTVNRIWQEYFGQGIVKTSEDFGTQGDPPSHPELLDWLAAEFRDSGWSFKHVHRLIVTSKTYRQSSNARPELDSRDPGNALLARQNRLRLPAELIRDEALAVSGLLYPKVGGPSVKPPQPAGVTDLGYAGGTKWLESPGKEKYRRGLYIHFQRTTPYPMLLNFDAPKGTVTQCRRGRSNTPLQALNLLNDPVFVEAASALAQRVEQGGSGFETALTKAFLLALNREPTAAESERLRAYFDSERAAAGADHAWTGLASVLLNLDEFITRE